MIINGDVVGKLDDDIKFVDASNLVDGNDQNDGRKLDDCKEWEDNFVHWMMIENCYIIWDNDREGYDSNELGDDSNWFDYRESGTVEESRNTLTN